MENTFDAAKIEAEIAKLLAETGKLNAERGKLYAEGAKFQRETFVIPFVTGAAVLGAAIGLVKLILH